MSHVALPGDSTFDNARYSPAGLAAMELVRAARPAGVWCFAEGGGVE